MKNNLTNVVIVGVWTLCILTLDFCNAAAYTLVGKLSQFMSLTCLQVVHAFIYFIPAGTDPNIGFFDAGRTDYM